MLLYHVTRSTCPWSWALLLHHYHYQPKMSCNCTTPSWGLLLRQVKWQMPRIGTILQGSFCRRQMGQPSFPKPMINSRNITLIGSETNPRKRNQSKRLFSKRGEHCKLKNISRSSEIEHNWRNSESQWNNIAIQSRQLLLFLQKTSWGEARCFSASSCVQSASSCESKIKTTTNIKSQKGAHHLSKAERKATSRAWLI